MVMTTSVVLPLRLVLKNDRLGEAMNKKSSLFLLSLKDVNGFSRVHLAAKYKNGHPPLLRIQNRWIPHY